MAQELADKIRAAAQAKGIDPEIALRIARAESANDPTAKAKTSSAGGVFQVVDKTWKEFGGKPGKKFDADENIRVGTDIISSNTNYLRKALNRDPKPAEVYAAHYFGPSGAKSFLTADPATPIVDILGKAAVKANPNLQGKNVGQVMAQLETKMGQAPKRPDVSRETPEPPARNPLPPSLPPMATGEDSSAVASRMADLGPGYQAALALSFLADTDDKEDRDIDREPGIAEKWLAEQPAAPSVMAQFSDVSIKSPFAEPKPQMLASGGMVQRMSNGGLPFTPTAMVRPSARRQLDEIKAEYDRYNNQVGEYNTQADAYMAQENAYNAAVEAYNAGERTEDFTGVAPTAPPAAPVAPGTSIEQYEALGQKAKRDVKNRNLALQVASDPRQFGLMGMEKFFAEGGEVGEESAPDVGRPTVSETQLAKVMFPDLPVAEAVYLIRGGQRQSTPQGEMLSGNLGAQVPLGKDASAMLMLAGSRPERSMSESKALMAAFNKRVGDEGGLDINVVRPLDAPPGIFAGGLSASYPLGEGRISGSVNALKLPDQDPRITGYGVGYGGRVGPGNLSAGIMKQKDGPYSGQIEYRLPIGRADGSPEEGEESGFLSRLFGGGKEDPLKGMKKNAEQIPEYRAMLEYLKSRDAVPEIRAGYLPGPIDAMFSAVNLPFIGAVGKGDIKINREISGPEYEKFLGPSTLAHEMAHATDRQLQEQAGEQSGMFSKGNQFTDAYGKMVGSGGMREGKKRTELARKYYPEFVSGNRDYRATPYEIVAHGVGKYAGPTTADNAPPHVDATAATEFQILLDLARRNSGTPVKRADGSPEEGERLTPQQIERIAAQEAMEREAASRPATVNPNIQRQGEAARRLAAMRDVNTLPDPKTYAAVSGFLGQAPDELGFSAMHPDAEGIKRAGQVGFGVGTALQVAPIVGGAMKAAQLGPSSGGKATAASQLGAIKMRGGTFGYTGQSPGVSKLDYLLDEYAQEAKSARVPQELQDFLKAKAPKYFSTSYGTAEDPLRTAIRERRIEPFGRDQPKLPPYMVDAARNPEARGHMQAKMDLERMYDEMTGVRAYAYKPEGSQATERGIRQDISEKMGQEGVPIEARNPPSVDTFSTDDFAAYPTSSRMLRQLVESQETLPQNLQQALRTGEPIFDVDTNMFLLRPSNVIEALQQVPANKLKNMSFPEALIQGTQALAPIRDYRSAVDLAEKGAKVPRQALDMFTQPVAEAPATGGNWVQLTKPVATELEGKLMKHSVGGYGSGETYGTGYTGLPYGGKKAFDEGLVRVYSLRDKQGLPEVTVEMAKSDAGKGDIWNVTQIRGRFNSEPLPQTREDIFNLLDKVDRKEGLFEIKPNSYAKSPTGESVESSSVDWGREYELWKQSAE